MAVLIRSAVFFGIIALFLLLVDNVLMPYYVQQGRTTKVPDVVGLPVNEALQILENQGLSGKEAEVRQDKQYPEGTVALQIPAAGSEVKFGRGVYLTISGGEAPVAVPSLRGRSVRDATLALERFNLRIGEIRYQVSAEYPENTIIEQAIAEGTKVAGRTAVPVVVSQGLSADRIPVPNVIARSLSDAERSILSNGLSVGNISYQPNWELLPNTVIDQFPRFGSFVARGDSIDLFVAQKSERRSILEN